jgi:hypothetical protein
MVLRIAVLGTELFSIEIGRTYADDGQVVVRNDSSILEVDEEAIENQPFGFAR